jgi:hypothetical protein
VIQDNAKDVKVVCDITVSSCVIRVDGEVFSAAKLRHVNIYVLHIVEINKE